MFDLNCKDFKVGGGTSRSTATAWSSSRSTCPS